MLGDHYCCSSYTKYKNTYSDMLAPLVTVNELYFNPFKTETEAKTQAILRNITDFKLNLT